MKLSVLFVSRFFAFVIVTCMPVKNTHGHVKFYAMCILHVKWWVGGKDLSSWVSSQTKFLHSPKPAVFPPTQKLWGDISACLKQSKSQSFMQSVWKSNEQRWIKRRIQLVKNLRFISPCLPAVTKRPRILSSTVVTFHVLTAVYFKFELFVFA